MAHADPISDPVANELSPPGAANGNGEKQRQDSFLYQRSNPSLAKSGESLHLPLPVTSPSKESFKTKFRIPGEMLEPPLSPNAQVAFEGKVILPRDDEKYLLPANMVRPYLLAAIYTPSKSNCAAT